MGRYDTEVNQYPTDRCERRDRQESDQPLQRTLFRATPSEGGVFSGSAVFGASG
jgi:hypothetical protein